jgi:hypothetical protein
MVKKYRKQIIATIASDTHVQSMQSGLSSPKTAQVQPLKKKRTLPPLLQQTNPYLVSDMQSFDNVRTSNASLSSFELKPTHLPPMQVDGNRSRGSTEERKSVDLDTKEPSKKVMKLESLSR